MWLINTSTITLKEFPNDKPPLYAILSHRWGSLEDEVSHRDMRKGLKLNSVGHKKIRDACGIAKAEKLDWIWVDTCCIDKRSSAELSEAVNSMFAWYKKSQVCYAYFKDAGFAEGDWQQSEWWWRGWTLQELLAPRRVDFFDHDWRFLGTRTELVEEISFITRIPAPVFESPAGYMQCCVAQRMSWAAKRRTTRVEDRAYALLGLFQINMPLLYGEGTKAFQRLQLEILQKYPDESLFAWETMEPFAHRVLAGSPDAFASCSVFRPRIQDRGTYQGRETPPRVTSWGIEMRANARRLYYASDVLSRDQKLMWALTLTMANRDRIAILPCTIVLIAEGSIRFGYKRLQCFHVDPADSDAELEKYYRIGKMEENVPFFLQFDGDLLGSSDEFLPPLGPASRHSPQPRRVEMEESFRSMAF